MKPSTESKKLNSDYGQVFQAGHSSVITGGGTVSTVVGAAVVGAAVVGAAVVGAAVAGGRVVGALVAGAAVIATVAGGAVVVSSTATVVGASDVVGRVVVGEAEVDTTTSSTGLVVNVTSSAETRVPAGLSLLGSRVTPKTTTLTAIKTASQPIHRHALETPSRSNTATSAT